ncbi:hypothetical protein ISN45_Aa01g038010 [Arabidopsis thaliana x Arabidopsis arenosa]|uniref:Plant thionin family protein n=1 Tax=Arabidopsis thaliana x Arabidopsis arenosa TaxID=1240361 RepID=A0A8T2C711_9BRAS|nr:hypothetical protein ISN45_Aa01g038010 [Arabidopsis thaliana x Arabidopsis arenosa]
MSIKKCVVLMVVVLVVMVAMVEEVEGLSTPYGRCMDICMTKCNFFFTHPEKYCREKCNSKCHRVHPSQSSQVETIGVRNING